VYRPKRYFAKTVIATMLFTIALFFLVNVAYVRALAALKIKMRKSDAN
jgi:hypothetical protein